jgi:hypothetical protein
MKKRLFLGMLLTICVVIITFVFSQFYPGGMISYWKFDEGEGIIAYDSVNGNHVDINSTTWDDGQVNGALRFHGMYDGYIKVTDIGTQFGGRGSFSVETWIKPEECCRHNYFFCLGDVVNPSRGVNIGYFPYTLGYRGGGGQASASIPIELNVWHHIAITYDGLNVKVFQDGIEVISVTDTWSIATNPDLWIGWPDTFYIFDGIVDEYAIYDRLLTEEEIQQHYHDGLGYEVECVPPPAGMVSWWPGDGDADDIVDGNHGMEMNGVTYAPGMVGQAFSFDGSSYVSVPDNESLTLGDAFTIDLWVNFDYVSGRLPFIGHDEGGGTTNKWIFWYDSSGHRPPYGPALRFHLVSVSPYHHGDPVVYPWNPTPSEWYHVAVTKSGSIYTLYIDGNQVITETYNQPIPDVNYPLTIGRAEAFRFPGLIDEVEIFDRALTEEEIQAIYYAGSAGKCKVRTVDIDIKPGSYPNSINLGSNGNVPVAIFSTEDFDATTVDPSTITLAGAEVRIRGKGDPSRYFQDVDGDGLLDVLVHVDTQTFVPATDAEAILEGETFDGKKIRGVDSINIVNE